MTTPGDKSHQHEERTRADRSSARPTSTDPTGTDRASTDQASADRAAELARRRREFIRAHHPDRGGDPERFIAGLRDLDRDADSHAGQALPAGPSRTGPSRPGSPRPGSPRPAAPSSGTPREPPPRVVVVAHRPLLTRVLIAAIRRLRQGKPPPRVR